MSKPPLWKVMCDAYCAATNSSAKDLDVIASGNAAEICALRDWLVPEESAPSDVEFWPDADSEREWQHSQRLRALLTAEAARAERGEVES